MRNIENLSEFCTSVVGGLLSKSDKHCSTGVTIWGTGTAPTEASHSPYKDVICGGPRINVYGPFVLVVFKAKLQISHGDSVARSARSVECISYASCYVSF